MPKQTRVQLILTAFGKAACYALLFIGIQLFVSVAAALIEGIRTGLSGAAGPDASAEITENLLANTSLITLISNALTLLLLFPVFAAQKKSYGREISLFPLLPGAVWPLAIGALCLSAVVSLLLVLLPIPEDIMADYAEAAASLETPGLVGALSTVLFAPIAEEVIFRGLVYTRLRRAMPAWLACVLASLVFAVLHGQLLWIAYAFLMGVALTLVFERTGTLWSSILVHITFNLAGTYLVQYLPGSPLILLLGIFGIAAAWHWLSRVYPRS